MVLWLLKNCPEYWVYRVFLWVADDFLCQNSTGLRQVYCHPLKLGNAGGWLDRSLPLTNVCGVTPNLWILFLSRGIDCWESGLFCRGVASFERVVKKVDRSEPSPALRWYCELVSKLWVMLQSPAMLCKWLGSPRRAILQRSVGLPTKLILIFVGGSGAVERAAKIQLKLRVGKIYHRCGWEHLGSAKVNRLISKRSQSFYFFTLKLIFYFLWGRVVYP